jgi:hypothetical protein
MLKLTGEDYIEARDNLLEKDLIAFDGTLYQVLDLPGKPICQNRQLVNDLVEHCFKEVDHAR